MCVERSPLRTVNAGSSVPRGDNRITIDNNRVRTGIGPMADNSEGRCALTGNLGKFVRCHIIPQSFTKSAVKGAPLYQSTRGLGARRRWSSWYDQNLVTRDGEDLLSAIDDKAIKQLRSHQLVWSSWIAFRPHIEALSPLMPDHGYRRISLLDSDALIRFALSVAWRASASSLHDMKDATLEPDLESRLRDYVLGEKIVGTSRLRTH